ncbi:MAG: hypothetical protein GWP14_11085, partial [Actinobacteria bacterium]|nr:hypothetical protein [Actinomycetota bacterium]
MGKLLGWIVSVIVLMVDGYESKEWKMSHIRSGFAVLVILSLLLGWTSQAAAAEDSSANKYEELLRRLNAQEKRIAEQDKKIAELQADRKSSTAKQDKKIAQQDKKITELKNIELTPEQRQEFLKIYEDVKAQAKPQPHDFRVYWKDGIRMESADKKFKLKFGGRLMGD